MNTNEALSIYQQFHSQGPEGFKTAAQLLADYITTATDTGNAIYFAQEDVLTFSYKSPEAMDNALRIYDQMADLLPPDFKNHYGTGARAAQRGLAMYFEQQIRSINPFVSPEDVGEAVVERDWDFDGPEYSNVTFIRAEVTGQLEKVIQKIVKLRDERSETVIKWAVEGRAHALGVAKAGRGHQAHLPMHFSGLLNPAGMGHGYMSPWSKADFIAGCVGLRGSAKTYLEECSEENRQELLKSWIDGLTEFLLEGDQSADDKHRKFRDGDFHIKYHAAENWKEAGVKQPWSWVSPVATAQACLLVVIEADKFVGCDIIDILAMDTAQSRDLATKYYSDAKFRAGYEQRPRVLDDGAGRENPRVEAS
ncbi:hypothetical protein PFICI_06036 [Pestalotiopsis fici W106-1]|uniref:Uncharacterized protein n=1 Tax=Pestalotiopsis fici (strain W106-1 / CGMCC3.15140) TaxID=1229662 RepID=W3X4V0_PESFW|nr:uncharacterized protein PFICI_06036 [Pestalotiopsis fici W106-1]ETS81034.1 hypothetical protein PFICI_06036 [Pestalotiopsis fici W106-1]